MKRTLSLMLVCLLAMSMLTGCMGTIVVVGENPTEAPQTLQTEPLTVGALKTGLAVVTGISGSSSATADAAGAASYDVTLAAVTVDDAGVIRSCRLDSIGTTVNFDATGAITSDLTASVPTKNELGENYGMKAYGNAIAEWDEQAAAVCDFAIGKTAEELRNGAIDETGKAPAGSDLASSATIYLGGYIAAIESAVANATHLGAQSGDELTLVTLNSLTSSAAATEEKAGNAQLDCSIAAITTKDGVITSCIIDGLQAKVAFDLTGTITTDINAPVATKNELGENYGMKAYGNAIAEWNEQAASFSAYVTGKTADEVAGIAVNEKTAPVEEDLTSSVTIAIGDFQALIAKAMAAETAPVTEGALKTGLAVVTGISGSSSATADAAGAASYDVTLAAVIVDDAGVIQSCRLDSIGTTINFDATGAITSDLTASVPTKNELGENYGMKAYGNAIAEWDQQAAALCDFAIGKTAEELRNGAIDETGKAPAGSDLASSATIYLGGYIAAIEAAVANATHLGAQSGDELTLVTLNSLTSSAAATEEKAGNAQLDCGIAAITTKDGVITSCIIDGLQAKVAFDLTGTITTDITAPVATKNELGENYGMKAYGNAIAEWNEQAASFAAYVTGKTADEVAGIAVNEKTAPAEEDLVTSVTIAIGDFLALIAKALN